MTKILRLISNAVVGITILVIGIFAVLEGNIYDGFQCIVLAMILTNRE